MKIISWNVNGLRSIYHHGYFNWLRGQNADLLCLQEIKAQEEQLPPEILSLKNYHSIFNSARKKGYSGVAVYSKIKPLSVSRMLNDPRFDHEGRILDIKFDFFDLINIYLPHGGRDKSKLPYKLDVYAKFFEKLKKRKRPLIIVGDFNIAHKEIDLARPKQNTDNIMFTAQERKQIDNLMKMGFLDSFREFNQKPGNYTWISYRRGAREKGLGWRIDYIFVSQSLKPRLKNASIHSRKMLGSDHYPIEIEIGL